MRTAIGMTTLVVAFLAMSPVAIANAQNQNSNPASDFVSQAELQQTRQAQAKLQTAQAAQARQIKSLKGSVGALKSDVTGLKRQTEQIAPLSDQVVDQGVKIANMGNTQNAQDKSIASTQTTLSALTWGWAISCGAVILLAILGGCGLFLLRKKIVQDKEDFEKKIAATAQNGQIVYVFSSGDDNLREMRRIWKERRMKNPDGLPIPCTRKVIKDPDRGLNLEGDVAGYSFSFDNNGPIPVDDQKPNLLYGAERVPYREWGAHAAKILGMAPLGASTQPVTPITNISQHRPPSATDLHLPEVPDPTFGGLVDKDRSLFGH